MEKEPFPTKEYVSDLRTTTEYYFDEIISHNTSNDNNETQAQIVEIIPPKQASNDSDETPAQIVQITAPKQTNNDNDEAAAQIVEIPALKQTNDGNDETPAQIVEIAAPRQLNVSMTGTIDLTKCTNALTERPIKVIIGHNQMYITSTDLIKNCDKRNVSEAYINVNEIPIGKSVESEQNSFKTLGKFLEYVSEKSGWYPEIESKVQSKGQIIRGGGEYESGNNGMNNVDNFHKIDHFPVGPIFNNEKNAVGKEQQSNGETVTEPLDKSINAEDAHFGGKIMENNVINQVIPINQNNCSFTEDVLSRPPFPVYVPPLLTQTTTTSPKFNNIENKMSNKYLSSHLQTDRERPIYVRRNVAVPIRNGLESGYVSNNPAEIWN